MSYEEWLVEHARIATKPRNSLKFDDKLNFFHQLATLVNAGTPLLQAIELLAEQAESIPLRRVLAEIAAMLSAGSSLHAAAAGYPRVFDHSWIEVIRTGEVTGKMGHVLIELNKQVREARETQRKVKAALTYPCVLLIVAVLAITAMLWFVVPTFSKMFNEMGAKLPEVTQFVVNASNFVVHDGVYVLVGVAATGFYLARYASTETGRRRIGGILLVTPTLGDLMIQTTMYKFTSNLALLLNSGVPMLETLVTLQGILQRNPIYRDALERVHGRVAAGQPLSSSLSETGLFASMLVNMVDVGEQSGQLAHVMEQVAPYFKDRIEALIGRTSKILEPIIIVGMGAAVAVMMISIYMPMFEMSGNIK